MIAVLKRVGEEEEAGSVPDDQEAFKNSRATSGSQCFVRLLFGQLLSVCVSIGLNGRIRLCVLLSIRRVLHNASQRYVYMILPLQWLLCDVFLIVRDACHHSLPVGTAGVS